MKQAEYSPKEYETSWQERWLQESVFAAKEDGKNPYYQLETFPYPSGAGLHVGHPKGYIAEDINARFMRMQGKDVLYTMGWDAFGLPTENYALQVKKSPQQVAQENVENFKRQVQMFGLSYDWDREINTSDPGYYKWTQWIFLKLFEKGLAYRKKASVNWCPKDHTVLANEQVVNGACERCGSEIIQKEMDQWFFKITDYADRLVDELEGLDWPSASIKRQSDWIGRSEGAEIEFDVAESNKKIIVFTTRPDTLFGATYMVLAPEHALVEELKDSIQNYSEVKKYVESTLKKTERQRQEDAGEKTGVELKGVKAINPATKEEIPIWIADYVLASYGTGAIMAVPAHDQRDLEFAEKFNLDIRQVVASHFVDPKNPPKKGMKKVERDVVHVIIRNPKDDTFLLLDWKGDVWGDRPPRTFIIGGIEDNEDVEGSARREILEETGYKNLKSLGDLGIEFHTEYCASHKGENRYAKIRIAAFDLIDEEKEVVSEKEQAKHDPVWMSRDAVLEFLNVVDGPFAWSWYQQGKRAIAGDGILINSGKYSGMTVEGAIKKMGKDFGVLKTQYRLRDWSVSRQRYWGVPIPIIHCNKCGEVPVPEDQLPVELPVIENFRPEGMPPLAASKKFMNVSCPKCGSAAQRDPETLDTFVDSSWYFLRYTDPHNEKALADPKKLKHWMPVQLYVIGAEHTTLHLLYARFIYKFLQDQKVIPTQSKEPFLTLRHVGLIQGADGQKMSKSKGNVVNPDELITQFGTDAFRVYEMFMGPFEDGQPWDTTGVKGAQRFLSRVWTFVNEQIENTGATPDGVVKSLHKAIKKVGDDIPQLQFNTAIAALMTLINDASGNAMAKTELESFVKLIHPFAPHMGQELWKRLGHDTYLDFEPWPKYDPILAKDDMITIGIQVNGKVRADIEVAVDESEESVREKVMALPQVQKQLDGSELKKFIYIPGRIISIVVE